MSISIPVPDSGCPALAATTTDTTQASGLGAIANLVSTIGSMLATISSWIGNPSKFVSDVGNWVTRAKDTHGFLRHRFLSLIGLRSRRNEFAFAQGSI